MSDKIENTTKRPWSIHPEDNLVIISDKVDEDVCSCLSSEDAKLIVNCVNEFGKYFNDNQVLEIEWIDRDRLPLNLVMMDGKKYTIGVNVRDFYSKLLSLPAAHRCEILQVKPMEIIEYVDYFKKNTFENLLLLLNSKWYWRMDDEICDFSDAELNENLFQISLTKKQIIAKIKRKTFDVSEALKIIEWFSNQDEIKDCITEND